MSTECNENGRRVLFTRTETIDDTGCREVVRPRTIPDHMHVVQQDERYKRKSNRPACLQT